MEVHAGGTPWSCVAVRRDTDYHKGLMGRGGRETRSVCQMIGWQRREMHISRKKPGRERQASWWLARAVGPERQTSFKLGGS